MDSNIHNNGITYSPYIIKKYPKATIEDQQNKHHHGTNNTHDDENMLPHQAKLLHVDVVILYVLNIIY